MSVKANHDKLKKMYILKKVWQIEKMDILKKSDKLKNYDILKKLHAFLHSKNDKLIKMWHFEK